MPYHYVVCRPQNADKKVDINKDESPSIDAELRSRIRITILVKLNLSRDARKPVFGVSDQIFAVSLKVNFYKRNTALHALFRC